MFRITKLTDYALVILTQMHDFNIQTARDLSLDTHIPIATTNKILKSLVAHQICTSKTGKNGGFQLAIPKNKISLLHIIKAIEGEHKKLTDCHITQQGKQCSLKKTCKISHQMSLIDKEIHNLLSTKLLSELV